MTAFFAIVSWLTVCGLFWLAAMCLVATVIGGDFVYALFSALLGVLALSLAFGLVREGGR